MGERGQAKTRIVRWIVNLLDAEAPAIVGCEINDHPLPVGLRALRDLLVALPAELLAA